MNSKWIDNEETAKEIILSVLPEKYFGSIKDLIHLAIFEAMKKGIIPASAENYQNHIIDRSAFDETTWLLIDSAIWQLFNQGIIIPGSEYIEQGVINYRVSPRGRKFIDSGQFDVYLKNRFIESLDKIAPNIDLIARKYIYEALTTFYSQSYLASAVMIGCAAERLLILLEKALTTFLEKKYQKEKDNFLNELKRIKGTAGKREIIIKRLHSKIKEIIPDEEPNRLIKFLEFTFALIAETRNEAGHPIGAEISSDESAHLLWQFKIIAPKIRNLIINMDSEETWSGKK